MKEASINLSDVLGANVVMITRGGAEAADTGKGTLAKNAAWQASYERIFNPRQSI